MARLQGNLLDRSFRLAQSVLRIVDTLPNNPKGWEIGRQLIRCGTSIGANLREANNALTDAEFAHKCSISRKEASETHYWLELCEGSELLKGKNVNQLIGETDEIVRILSTIVRKTHTFIGKNTNQSKSLRSPIAPTHNIPRRQT